MGQWRRLDFSVSKRLSINFNININDLFGCRNVCLQRTKAIKLNGSEYSFHLDSVRRRGKKCPHDCFLFTKTNEEAIIFPLFA